MKKRMTAMDFMDYKAEGRRIAMMTAYDYTSALLVDEERR